MVASAEGRVFAIYNNLPNSLNKILIKNKNQSFENHLSNLSPKNGNLWSTTKILLKYKLPLVPIINPHGELATTDGEKAELFKEHLTETFMPHSDIQIPSHTDIVNRSLVSPLSTFPAVKHFTPGEVKFTIQKYSLKKSPGFDLITAEVARSLPKRAIVRVGTSLSGLAKINAGIPQGGILSPLLYNIYAADQPTSPNTAVAEFADDKAIISIHDNPHTASHNLQLHLDLMADWYKKWRIKVNQSKSLHTTFTLRRTPCPMVSQIPSSQTAKYLGLTIDRRLTWSHHIKTKRLALNARLRILKTLISNNKHTPLNTKLLIYKSLFKPMWTYGLQLWGNAKISNTNKIQTFQNKFLRLITNSPPYISNLTLHTDLKMKSIVAVAFYKRFHSKLPSHSNPLILNLATLTIPGNPPRRLKRKWCRDLLTV
ncbi:Reverse transcriptase domain [Cinara cedri]|uniref:Reverse transcriptase domain n=1 Tax=Cinara cedri TaxID=506608 RepID=A0A5E4NBL3_9HEMI|nr:Reverse transcriptase domain [Cinara cedri]